MEKRQLCLRISTLRTGTFSTFAQFFRASYRSRRDAGGRMAGHQATRPPDREAVSPSKAGNRKLRERIRVACRSLGAWRISPVRGISTPIGTFQAKGFPRSGQEPQGTPAGTWATKPPGREVVSPSKAGNRKTRERFRGACRRLEAGAGFPGPGNFSSNRDIPSQGISSKRTGGAGTPAGAWPGIGRRSR